MLEQKYKKIQIEIPEQDHQTYIDEFERANRANKLSNDSPLFKGKYFGKKFLAGEDAKEELEALTEINETEIIEKEVERVIRKNSPWLVAGFCVLLLFFIMTIIAFFRSRRN